MNSAQYAAAETLLAWLAPSDASDDADGLDAVVGFGHFDLRIADRCAEIFRRGGVARVIFTGGIGAGTGDLGQPEADAFLAHVARHHPEIPRERIVVENTSTNTGENIHHTLALLAEKHPEARLTRVALVANPSRQRRVAQTWRQLVPKSAARSAPPRTTLDEELSLFAARRQDLFAQMVGEVDRLIAYPARGWIAPGEVPDAVRSAADVCRP